MDSLGGNGFKNELCNYLAGHYNHSNPPNSPTNNQITLTATKHRSSIKPHVYKKLTEQGLKGITL